MLSSRLILIRIMLRRLSTRQYMHRIEQGAPTFSPKLRKRRSNWASVLLVRILGCHGPAEESDDTAGERSADSAGGGDLDRNNSTKRRVPRETKKPLSTILAVAYLVAASLVVT